MVWLFCGILATCLDRCHMTQISIFQNGSYHLLLERTFLVELICFCEVGLKTNILRHFSHLPGQVPRGSIFQVFEKGSSYIVGKDISCAILWKLVKNMKSVIEHHKRLPVMLLNGKGRWKCSTPSPTSGVFVYLFESLTKF